MRVLTFLAALMLWTLPAAAQDDRGFLQAFLENNLSAAGREVRITGFKGLLSSTATLETLTIADEKGIWLTLNSVALDWSRLALLRGRLEVAELSAKTVQIARLPVTDAPKAGFSLPELPAAEATGFSLPDLPVSVKIDKFAVDTLQLAPPVLGQKVALSVSGKAALNDGTGSAELALLRKDGAEGRFALDAAFSNTSRLMDLSLEIAEAKDGIAATLLGLPGTPSVDLTVKGQGPISDFTTRISLATDGVQRLGGDVTLLTRQTPTGPEQAFTADLSGDIRPLLLPAYHDFIGPEVSLAVAGSSPKGGGLRLSALDLKAQSFDLAGQITLGPDGWPQLVDVDGTIASPDGTPVLLALPGVETRMDRAGFTAQFDVTEGQDWTVSLNIDRLERQDMTLRALRLGGRGRMASGDGAPEGALTGQVTLDVAGLSLTDIDLARAIGSDLSAGFQLDFREDQPLHLTDLTLKGADYGLSGDLQFKGLLDGFDPKVSGTVALNAVDLSRFAGLAQTPLAGRAALDLTGQAAPLQGTFDLSLAGRTQNLALGQPRLDPLLDGTGTLVLKAQRSANGTKVEQLTIRTAQIDLEASATLKSEGSVAQIGARLRDAAQIDPQLSGPATLSGTLRQNGSDIDLNLAATGPGKAVIALNGTATLTDRTFTNLQGTANVAAASLTPYSGLTGYTLAGGVDLTATGNADLVTGAFSTTLDGTGTALSTGMPDVDKLLRGRSNISTRLRHTEDGVLVFERLDLKTSEITVDLTGSVSDTRSRLRFAVDLRDIGLFTPDFNGPVTGEGLASAQGGEWTIDTRLTGPGGTNASVAGRVAPDASRANLTIRGAAPLALANRFIQPNLVTGQASFDLALNGPLALTSLSGSLRSQGGTLTLPDLRMGLQDIEATVTLSQGRAQVQGAANVSGGGRLSVRGPVSLGADLNADLAIQLSRVAVTEPGLYATTLDGTVTVTGPLAGGARITGGLTLPSTEVRLAEVSTASGIAINGITHINEPAAVRQTRQFAGLLNQGSAGGFNNSYPLDVTISAPARIFIRGRGLDAELGGALRLRGTTQNVIPDGQFSLIRGRLDILGKRLALTQASARLLGNFDPFIRIVAETQNDGVSVQFVIEGLATEPDISMTSNPSLPEEEILARVLFGRDITQISALQAVQIATAINTLAGKGGAGIVDRLRRTFGLDDFGVVTSDTGETSLRAGKYISENIYTDVTVAPSGQSQINLNLSLSPSVTARGTLKSDGSTGLGLFFEKDY